MRDGDSDWSQRTYKTVSNIGNGSNVIWNNIGQFLTNPADEIL